MIDLEKLDVSVERGGWVHTGEAQAMRAWIREAVRLLGHAASLIDAELPHTYRSKELRAHIEKVKLEES